MTTHIDGLYELCKEQPFDVQKIQNYISSNQMTSEEVTRATLKLCDYGDLSYTEYFFGKNKEPQPEELPTYNWESLFDILIDNGLDPDLVVCDDGVNYENVLQSLRYFDDGDLGARIARNILSKGGTPNVMIDHTSLFEDVDIDFIMDVNMELYPYKWQVDVVFYFWLVLVGFGGVVKDGELPVIMRENYTPDIFKEFEKFTYNIIREKDDFELQIIEKETNTIVATV